MRKRLLSIFLCVCMVLSLIPCTALAADTPPRREGWCGATGDEVHWALTGSANNMTLTLAGKVFMDGKMADFAESEVQPWYYYRNEITKVIIDTTAAPSERGQVTEIGSYAFSELKNLKEVTLTEGITRIGDYAFQGCKSLPELVLPESVTDIGKGAFQGCDSMTQITIPNATDDGKEILTEIKEDTFLGCAKLQTIKRKKASGYSPVLTYDKDYTFSTVTKVGTRAFKGCAALTAIKLPKVETIDAEAFYNCSSLGTAELPEDGSVKKFQTIGESVFKNCKALKKIDIPWTVTSIGAEAFSGTGLNTIRIPEQVVVIGDGAFSNITGGNTDVTFTVNSSIENNTHTHRIFGVEVFGRSELRNVVFEPCTDVIENGWFDNCSFQTMTIPASVTTIAPNAFTNCTGVTAFVVKPENRDYKAPGGILFSYDLTKLIRYPVNKDGASYTVPSYVNEIAANAFYKSGKLTSVTIADDTTITDIGERNLTIGDNAFKECENLGSVDFGNQVIAIGKSAFEGDKKLVAVMLPDSVKTLGEEAFKDCAAMSTLALSNSLEVIEKSSFESCKALTSVKLPHGMTKVGEAAFKNCGKMKSLIFTPWLVTIGNYAFQACKELTTVEFHVGLKTIGAYAFADCSKLKGEEDLVLRLPESVTSVGEGAFSKSGIEGFTVLKGTLGDSVFEGCNNLTSVQLGDGVTAIGEKAFADTNLQQPFDLPVDLRKVSKEMFKNCRNLTSITIPDKVEIIDEGAFWRSGVETVYLYPSVTTIEGSMVGNTAGPKDAFFESALNKIVYYGPKTDWENKKDIKDISVAFTSAFENATFDGERPTAEQYTITFDPREGFTLSSTIAKIKPEEKGGKAKLSSIQIPKVTRLGYNFEYWTLSDGTEIDPLTYEFDRNTVLYANWSVIPEPTYKVVLPLGGKATPNPAKAGETVKLTITTGSKETFLDWSIKPSVKFIDDYTETSRTTWFVMPATDIVVVPHVLNSSSGTKYDDYIVSPGIRPTPECTADKLKELLDKVLSSGDKDYYYDIELVTKSVLSDEDAAEGDEDTPAPVAMAVFGALPDSAVVYGAEGTVLIAYPDNITYATAKDYTFSAAIVDANGNVKMVTVTPSSKGLVLNTTVDKATVKLTVTKKPVTVPDKPGTSNPGTSNPGTSNPGTSNPGTTVKPDPTPVTYAIKDASGKGGTVTVRDEAEEDETVTVKVKPKDGYELKEIIVYKKNGKELKLKEKSDSKFTFTMPDERVTVEATFQEEDEEEDEPKKTTTAQTQMTVQQLFGPGASGVAGIPNGTGAATSTGTTTGTTANTAFANAQIPFTDVPASSAQRTAIGYVYSKGLMTGTNATSFSPDTTVSRAMVVAILHRLEGSPSAAKADFEDVEEGQWYEAPIAWASANNIVSGYSDDKFGPEDTVTKEQLVSILARYSLLKKYDTIARADISGYTDSAKVSQYALGAMQWAAGKQLFAESTLKTLNPTDAMTRAQTADMLMRFCQNVANI